MDIPPDEIRSRCPTSPHHSPHCGCFSPQLPSRLINWNLQPFTIMSISQVIAKAAGTITSWSGITPADDPRRDFLLATLRHDTPQASRVSTLSGADQILFFDHRNSLCVLTCPLPGTDAANNAILLGSLGDTITIGPTVSIAAASVNRYVLTLVSMDDAISLRLPHLPPSTLDPYTLHGQGQSDTDQIDPTRLNWPLDANNVGSAPVFAAIPLIFPVLPGMTIPPGISLGAPAPPDAPAAFRVFLEGHRWLHRNNHGKSLHQGGRLFRPADIQLTGQLSDKTYTNLTAVPINTLAYDNPHHHHVETVFRRRAEFQIYSHVKDTASLPVGPSPALPSTLKQVLAAVPKSEADKEHIRDQEAAILSFRLLFAYESTTEVGGASVTTVALPDLSDECLQFMKFTKQARAVRYFQESFGRFLQNVPRMRDFLSGHLKFNIKQADQMFVSCLRSFSFLATPWHVDEELLDDHLAVVHFLSGSVTNRSYQSRLAEGQTILIQEDIGEDKSKIQKKATALYCQGQLHSVSDVFSAIACLRAFAEWASKDGSVHLDKMFLFQPMLRFVELCCSYNGRAWIDKHQAIPSVVCHLLGDTQTCLLPFVMLAQRSSLRKLVDEGQPLPLDEFTNSRAVASSVVTRLTNAVLSGDLGDYRDAPAVMKRFGCLAFKSAANDPPSLGQRSSQNSGPRKPSRGGRPGFITFSGAGRPPLPNIFIPHFKTKENTKLCSNFIYDGKECPYPDCKFGHLSDPKRLAPAKQKELSKFVTDHSGVSWTAGRSPFTSNGRDAPSDPKKTTGSGGLVYSSPFGPQLSVLLPAGASAAVSAPNCVPSAPPCPIMDQVPPPDIVESIAPFKSLIVQGSVAVPELSRRDREAWARATLPSALQLHLETNFGKKNSTQRSFMSAVRFRHILLLLVNSGFLDYSSATLLDTAYVPFAVLRRLINSHVGVDFRPLRSPPSAALPDGKYLHRLSRMATACLLHYNGDVASVVRFLGGVHTGSHRSWQKTRAQLMIDIRAPGIPGF